ncbi:PHP domain protein [Chitinivibrio alkaliphilus ACht1]|uniref:PHP domain protein n=2 Tax=Chitinivibrio TaxID=1505231 RepID=U7D6Q0_9BACT|nr:PHP domain protein [Chitinivibrio alkaliphilus ACht1]
MNIRADLHIHSCLSPCASLDMGPRDIVAQACERNLTHLALTDHNSTRNCVVMAELCAEAGLVFFPGMEVTTSEEIHVLLYFPSVAEALRAGKEIEASLSPRVPLRAEQMGYEAVVDRENNVCELLDWYLSVSTTYSLNDLSRFATSFGACIVPAHILKPLFSITSQLGFLLPNAPYDAVEISHGNRHRAGEVSGYPWITSSDSHYLDDIGKCFTEFHADTLPKTPREFFAYLPRRGSKGV